MAKPSESSYNLPKRRVDRSEEAREWNKAASSISSLAQAGVEAGRRPVTKIHRRPFQPYDPFYNSEDNKWFIWITPGWLLDSHVLNQGAVNEVPLESAVDIRTPTIEGPDPEVAGDTIQVDIDAEEPIALELPSLNCYIYLLYETDNHGNIQPRDPPDADKVVTIEAFDEEQDSIHHEPPDENGGGVEGAYYWQIAKIQSVGEEGEERPHIVHEGYQSNFMWQEAFVVNNLGGGSGSNVYRRFFTDDDEHQLRTIYGRYGLDDTTDDFDVILTFDAENRGTGEEVFIDTDDTTADGKAGFRTLVEGADLQISVDTVGDSIRIQGNQVDGSLIHRDCDENDTTLINWIDGLVTTPGNITFRAGCQYTPAP